MMFSGCASEPMATQQPDCNSDAWAVAETMGWPEPAVVGGMTLAATDVKIQACSIDN